MAIGVLGEGLDEAGLSIAGGSMEEEAEGVGDADAAIKGRVVEECIDAVEDHLFIVEKYVIKGSGGKEFGRGKGIETDAAGVLIECLIFSFNNLVEIE